MSTGPAAVQTPFLGVHETGSRPDPAERRVDHVPYPARILRRQPRGPHQVVDVDVIDDRVAGRDIVHHRHRHVVEPDIFAQRLARRAQLRDDAVGKIMHVDRRRRGRRGRMRYRARRQSSPRVIRVGRPFGRVVGLIDLRQPALDIVLAGQAERARPAVGEGVAGDAMSELKRPYRSPSDFSTRLF